jgi:hypothetical protein
VRKTNFYLTITWGTCIWIFTSIKYIHIDVFFTYNNGCWWLVQFFFYKLHCITLKKKLHSRFWGSMHCQYEPNASFWKNEHVWWDWMKFFNFWKKMGGGRDKDLLCRSRCNKNQMDQNFLSNHKLANSWLNIYIYIYIYMNSLMVNNVLFN